MMLTKKILIVGAGYVGLAYTCFFSQKFNVTVLDIDQEKVKRINDGKSYTKELLIGDFLKKYKNNIKAKNVMNNFSDYDLAIMCLPTDYDEKSNFFDTKILSDEIERIFKNDFNGLMVIKSTVPVGYTDSIQKKFENKKIIFSPEFLREGNALNDILEPSRIVVGGDVSDCDKFCNYVDSCLKTSSRNFSIKSSEAESVKLFSNTFLAMRVSYFNELDSFCIENELNSENIINAVCEDERIGHHYNNPSFGYGGYCLPKDTKQLLANYKKVPQNLIESIVHANQTRKDFITKLVLKLNVKNIGIYKLAMKKDSDNIRESSILSIIDNLKKENLNIFIYEPLINKRKFNDCEIINDFEKFKNKSDLILANRYEKILESCKEKLFTRDIFYKE